MSLIIIIDAFTLHRTRALLLFAAVHHWNHQVHCQGPQGGWVSKGGWFQGGPSDQIVPFEANPHVKSTYRWVFDERVLYSGSQIVTLQTVSSPLYLCSHLCLPLLLVALVGLTHIWSHSGSTGWGSRYPAEGLRGSSRV